MNKDLVSRYLNLYPKNGLSSRQIQGIENKLSVNLPEDLKRVLSFYNGYYELAHLPLYSFDSNVPGWNICEETLRLRKSIKLPKNMIVLGEPDEGIIIMEIIDNPKAILSRIYWLGIGDAYNLIEGKPLEDNPIIYPSFADFFEYLLNEEEKRRSEDASS